MPLFAKKLTINTKLISPNSKGKIILLYGYLETDKATINTSGGNGLKPT
jgi:hypothetical protein